MKFICIGNNTSEPLLLKFSDINRTNVTDSHRKSSLHLRVAGAKTGFVRVFTHMKSYHQEEALSYKFKHKRADKSLSDVDRVPELFTAEYLINQIAITTDCGVATHKGPNICTHNRS